MGKGAFGTVYSIKDYNTEKEYAVKVLVLYLFYITI